MNAKLTEILIMTKVSFGICLYAMREQSYVLLLNWEFFFRKRLK